MANNSTITDSTNCLSDIQNEIFRARRRQWMLSCARMTLPSVSAIMLCWILYSYQSYHQQCIISRIRNMDVNNNHSPYVTSSSSSLGSISILHWGDHGGAADDHSSILLRRSRDSKGRSSGLVQQGQLVDSSRTSSFSDELTRPASLSLERLFVQPNNHHGSTNEMEGQGHDNNQKNDISYSKYSNTSFMSNTNSMDPKVASGDNEQRQPNRNDEDTDGETTTDDSVAQSPAVAGWSPDIYPNPITQPDRCRIAYLLNQLGGNHPGDDAAINKTSSSSPWPSIVDNKSSSSTSASVDASAMDTDVTTTTTPPLMRLCDPDWVLGGIALERLANVLYNFSNAHNACAQTNAQPPWEVGVGHVRHRHHERRHRQLQLLQEPVLLPRVLTSSTATSTSSSSSSGLVLPVSLAVATVRKMNIPAVLRPGSYYDYAYEDQDDLVNDAAQVFARTLHNNWWWDDNNSDDHSSNAADNLNIAQIHAGQMSSTAGTGNGDGGNTANTHVGTIPCGSLDCSCRDSASSNDNSSNRRNFRHKSSSDYGIVIFLSIRDHVCFISTGAAISRILPWWRLDRVVAGMKPSLRRGDYGGAMLQAVQDLAGMVQSGPPTLHDRIRDFITRFGVVMAFALFTLFFGAYGEYRDRRRRYLFAEQRSRLSNMEQDKARQLQCEYKTRACPICLEPFPMGDEPLTSNTNTNNDNKDQTDDNDGVLDTENPSRTITAATTTTTSTLNESTPLICQQQPSIARRSTRYNRFIDSKYGTPLRGADKRDIKLLRCGHIFCGSCWTSWVYTGTNPCTCPVCRRDIGKKLTSSSTTF